MASTDAEAGGAAPPVRRTQADKNRKYWRDNLTVMVSLLAVWFAVSYGAGILFRDFLDQFSVGTAPMGFWFAQQGSIFVFVALIFVYHALMTHIERRYDAEE